MDELQALLVETEAEAVSVADDLAAATAAGLSRGERSRLAANYAQLRTRVKRIRQQLKTVIA